jgi:phosphoglycerol transferase MdoB-like AlkP superfamily enzyme
MEKNSDEVVSLLPDFVKDFWFPVVLFFVFSGLFIWISGRIRLDLTYYNYFDKRRFFGSLLKSFVIVILTTIAIRGGIQDKPINIINAGEYTEPEYFPIVVNTPFTLLKTIDESALQEIEYFKDEKELEKVFNPVIKTDKSNSFRKLNVFIIILESFSAEQSAYLNPDLENGNYIGYTPVLDSLMRHSLVFHGFANGTRSIDGIPAIISSLPALLKTPYLSSPYVGNSIYSIAGMLKEKGISTAFFHGGTNGTMGFEAYSKIAGFDRYYGRDEYNNDDDYDGNWGIFDEPFLQYTAGKLDEMKKPFCSAVFTLSSHHPFTIPEKYKGKFRKGPSPIQESIMYADYSLGKFFETVSKYSWFDSTLFILTADHTSLVYHSELQNSLGQYEIPVIFYQHGKWSDTISPEIAQQTDIMPSVLDFLGYDNDFIAFGSSVFDTAGSHFAISYANGIYQLIKDDYLYQFNGENDVALFNIRNDKFLSRNILTKENAVANEMNMFTKAVVQQFNNRVIHDKLIIK